MQRIWPLIFLALFSFGCEKIKKRLGLGDSSETGQTEGSAAGLVGQGTSAKPAAQDTLKKLPLAFHSSSAKAGIFTATGASQFLHLTSKGISVGLLNTSAPQSGFGLADSPDSFSILGVNFAGSNSNIVAEPYELLPYKSNFFIGNDATDWEFGTNNYAKVRYVEVYAGIDIETWGTSEGFRYDFVVKPGAEAGVIKITFDNVDAITQAENGDLLLSIDGEQLVQKAPYTFQVINGEKTVVSSSYIVNADQSVQFLIDSYDHGHNLIIDPVIEFSTYLGGTSDDGDPVMTLAPNGDIILAGISRSATFVGLTGSPVSGKPSTGPDNDIFFVRLNQNTGAIIWMTYLGGSSTDQVLDISTDALGKFYLAGSTSSENFPTLGAGGTTAFRSAKPSGSASYAAKIGDDGVLVYSTFIDSGTGFGISVDGSGKAHVVGNTSTNFLQTCCGAGASHGGLEGFLVILTPNGDGTVMAALIGGAASDAVLDVEVAADGAVGIAGFTTSSNFPTTLDAEQRTLGLSGDGFFAIVDPTAAVGSPGFFVCSTLLGGNKSDSISKIAFDSPGNAVVTGATESTDFPVKNAFSGEAKGFTDLFVAKLNRNCQTSFSTYIGSARTEAVGDVAVDGSGRVFVTGTVSEGATFTTYGDTSIFTTGGSSDAFLTVFSPDGTVELSGNFGGTFADQAKSIEVTQDGQVIISGTTSSSNFPTANALRMSRIGAADLFLMKISGFSSQLIPDVAIDPGVKFDYNISQFLPPEFAYDYFFVTGPHGAILEVESGLLSWTPAVGQAPNSEYAVTLRISERPSGSGIDKLESFRIKVR